MGKKADVIDYLYQSIINNTNAYSHYISMWAIMISSFFRNDKNPHTVVAETEYILFFQELNNMIEQILIKEDITFKKIELIFNLKSNLQDNSTLYKALVEYQKSILLIIDALILYTGTKHYKKINDHLILMTVNNLSELHQRAYRRIQYLDYHFELTKDKRLNNLLIKNIEQNIIFIKKVMTDNYKNNQIMVIKLHKKIISLIRFKQEIEIYSKRNIDINNLSEPWISKTLRNLPRNPK